MISSRIDHFMYAAPDLNEGMRWAEDTFGVTPAYGGEHIGMGTCNALLSLGEVYLEIIAPDPAQALAGTLGEQFATLSTGGLVTFAVQGELAPIASVLSEHDIAARGPNQTQRKTTSGEVLVWELLIPRRTSFGARLPFFIDWLECPHPATTNPVAGEFQELVVSEPGSRELNSLFDAIGLDQEVSTGDADLAVRISGKDGDITLSSTPETRILSMG